MAQKHTHHPSEAFEQVDVIEEQVYQAFKVTH